jgi:hypothetical protein
LATLPGFREIPFSEISELLKMNPSVEEPLEGSISLKLSGQIERFFTFDTRTLRKAITKFCKFNC